MQPEPSTLPFTVLLGVPPMIHTHRLMKPGRDKLFVVSANYDNAPIDDLFKPCKELLAEAKVGGHSSWACNSRSGRAGWTAGDSKGTGGEGCNMTVCWPLVCACQPASFWSLVGATCTHDSIPPQHVRYTVSSNMLCHMTCLDGNT
jgi:hypothetical protein